MSRRQRVLRHVGRTAAYRIATSDLVEQLAMSSGTSRHIAFRHARRYVAGLNADAALAVVHDLRESGLAASVDLFGEDVDDAATANGVVARYLSLAETLADHPGTYLSLDCSHLGLDADVRACGQRVQQIAKRLPRGARLQLGAEHSARTDAILSVALAAAAEGAPVMLTVQANLRRSTRDIEDLARAGVPIRLVKGAYVEPSGIAHAWGGETDAAYVELATRLATLEADHSLATHDQAILERLLPPLERVAGATVEYLLGVRPDDARRLAAAGWNVRIYVPYGERWFRYAARRAAESIGA